MSEHPAVVFLLAAHDRAEAVARAVPCGPWRWEGRWDSEGNYMALVGPEGVPVIRSRTKNSAWSRLEWHPAFDEFLPEPAVVLRRVAADRQILAEHADEGARECRVCAPVDWDTEERPGRYRHPADFPCRTVLLLAKSWGWEETP